jgi:hypothetical protein
MATKNVTIEITGVSPLLMHRFPLIPLEAESKKSPEEQAEHAAYREEKSRKLYIPGVAINACLVAGASYSKGKGRATLAKIAAACLIVGDEYCYITDRNDKPVTDYEIDRRAVVIQATGGRIVRNRPKINEWKTKVNVSYEANLLTEDQVRTIFDNSGSLVGLLDFRPAKKGPYGRFTVTQWSTPK